MDQIRKRVAARIVAEQRQLHAEQMALARKRQRLVRDANKLREQTGVLFDRLGDGTVPTDRQQRELDRLARLARVGRELTAVNQTMAENTEKLSALEDREFTRRLKMAQALGARDEPLPGEEAAEIILLHEGRPMRLEEITRTAIETGLVKLNGKTPVQTISSYLAKCAKRGDKFVRVEPGTYGLKGQPSGRRV